MLTFLDELESEAIHVIRETAAHFKRPVILFSGGKDSIVLTHLVRKAFYPSQLLFPLLHVDTGYNFPETIKYRDDFVRDLSAKLYVARFDDAIAGSRNSAQSAVLRDALKEHKFDAALGGGRRDEEKARAKERFFSHRDASGAWNPDSQRPEVWRLVNSFCANDEHFRVFPISNWTELDVWQYIDQEKIQLPDLYFAADRPCVHRDGNLLVHAPVISLNDGESLEMKRVRFRTIGDATCTGAVESNASTVAEIIIELELSTQSERGSRVDDQLSAVAMEERKRAGYF
ncbi:MAG: sulfate adenylyltransferase subunit CysD [bacterium]